MGAVEISMNGSPSNGDTVLLLLAGHSDAIPIKIQIRKTDGVYKHQFTLAPLWRLFKFTKLRNWFGHFWEQIVIEPPIIEKTYVFKDGVFKRI